MKTFYTLLLTLLAFAAQTAHSYTFSTSSSGATVKWIGTRSMSMAFNPANAPTNAAAALTAAFTTWSTVSNADWHFVYLGTTNSLGGNQDFKNTASFNYISSDGTLALNSYWFYPNTGQMVESDIEFNTYYTWTTTAESGKYDVQNLAAHELGHSLSLADLYSAADTAKTMYGYAYANETKKRTLEPDDIAGIAALYPAPLPPITVTISTNRISESNGIVVVSATLSTTNTSLTTLNLAYTGSADSNDYYGPSKLYIPAGNLKGTATITAIADNNYETNETIALTVVSTFGASFSPPSTSDLTTTNTFAITLLDANTQPTVTLVLNTNQIPENAGIAWLNALLSGTSYQPITINLAFVGSATCGTDYTISTNTLVIPAGNSSVSTVLSAILDNQYQGNQIIHANITNAINATISDPHECDLTIIDDEPPPQFNITCTTNSEATDATFTVTLTPPSGLPATVNYLTVDGTANAGFDYSTTSGTLYFAAGQTNYTLSIPVINDVLNEDTETFLVQLSNPTDATLSYAKTAMANVLDNDPLPILTIENQTAQEAETNLQFLVTLSAPSGRAITIDFATTNGDLGNANDATTNNDYFPTNGTLCLFPGQTQAAIFVGIPNNDEPEFTKYFRLLLSNPTNASLATPEAIGTIEDDDAFPDWIATSDGNIVTLTSYTGSNTSLTLPTTLAGLPVSKLANTSFLTSPNITHIQLSPYLASIQAHTFDPCIRLESFGVPAENTYFNTVHQCLTDRSQTTLLTCPQQASGGLSLPSSIGALADNAFYNCNALENVLFWGAAPRTEPNAFPNTPDLTLFHFEGTAGWNTLTTTQPTKLWNPQPQIEDQNLIINGETHQIIIVETTEDLANPNWSRFATVTMSTPTCRIPTNPQTQQYYRLQPPPP